MINDKVTDMDNWVPKAAEVNDTLEEIKRTNQFILKRLNSQEERTKEDKNSNGISSCKIDIGGIRQLEFLSRKHDEKITQLMTSVSSINVTITTLCKQLTNANASKFTTQSVRTKGNSIETSKLRMLSKRSKSRAESRRTEFGKNENDDSDEAIKVDCHDSSAELRRCSIRDRRHRKSRLQENIDNKQDLNCWGRTGENDSNEANGTERNVGEAQRGGGCDSDDKTIFNISNIDDDVVKGNRDKCISIDHGNDNQSSTKEVTNVLPKRENADESIKDVRLTIDNTPVTSNEYSKEDVHKIQGHGSMRGDDVCDLVLKRKMTDPAHDNRIVPKQTESNVPRVKKDSNHSDNIKLDRNTEHRKPGPDKDKEDMEMMTKAYFVDDDIWMEQAKHDACNGVILDQQRGNGIDTIFVLDTSESMEGDGIRELKSAFTAIMDAIEENPRCDENVGVIVFGKETKSLVHITNRYRNVRRCLDNITCEGSSPMMAGMALTLGHIHGGAGTSVIGDWHVRPRIILISDGKLTDSRLMNGPDNQDLYDIEESKFRLISLSQKIGARYPVYCIPVGNHDLEILETIAALSNGKIVYQNKARQLGKFARNIMLAARTREHHPAVAMSDTADIKSMLIAGTITMDITDEDIVDMREFWSDPPVFKDAEDSDDIDNDNDGTVKCDPIMLPLGSRVKRGPDWQWKDQDSNGPGTVTGYDKSKKGWVRVEWDTKHRNVYRYGIYGNFDVMVTDEPRFLGNELIAVGCLVKRGKDWGYGNQDGGDSSVGSVFKVQRNGTVSVRWPNGKISSYKYGRDGKFEVEICDPYAPEIQQRLVVQAHGLAEGSNRDQSVESNIDRGRRSPVAEGLSIYDLAPTGGLSLNRATDTAGRDNTENNSRNLNLTSSNKQRKKVKKKKRPGVPPKGHGPVISQDTLVKSQDNLDVLESADKNSQLLNNRSDKKKGTDEERLIDEPPIDPRTENARALGKWQWQAKDGQWISYPDDVNRKIDDSFQNSSTTVLILVQDEYYRVILSKHIQINVNTKETHKIRRLDKTQDDH